MSVEKTWHVDDLLKFAKTSGIILDDFGLRKYSQEEATALLEILEERYSKSIVTMTSQVDPEG